MKLFATDVFTPNHIDLQRRRWLDPENRDPHWSYVEFMCSYFNDVLYDQDYDWAISEGLVTEDEAQAVATLHRLLDQHEAPQGDDCDNEKVLNDPAWHEIVKSAKRAQASLLAVLSNPDEKKVLLGDA
jgi:nucleotide-binding universal stress UspA family protein